MIGAILAPSVEFLSGVERLLCHLRCDAILEQSANETVVNGVSAGGEHGDKPEYIAIKVVVNDAGSCT
jgi:hypothetical protein